MFTARFPLELEMQLAQHATVRGLSKTAVAIEAMQEYFKSKPLKNAVSDVAAKSLTPVEQLEAIQAKIAAKYPDEPSFDWREARDNGRL